jgi:ornithine cyclodeaminase/alanine dehydrogenase-like protein (mu-crystallin family)
VDHARRALAAIANGQSQLTLPPKQVFDDPATGGDFRVMPCELRRGREVTKTVKLVGTNAVQRRVPDQITVGKLFVLDPEENFVSAVIECCLLSSARTGVCAALAIDALAPGRDSLTVIGSGRVGLYSALYAVSACGIKHVVFCDIVAARAQQAGRWLSARYRDVKCEARPLDALAAAEIVVLATTSDTSIASPPGWNASLVVSLGADTNTQSELDPAWARSADIYCDTLDSLRFGDLRAWTESGMADAAAVTELLEVYRHPPKHSERPRVFVSTGSALFDNVTARYLLDQGRPATRSRR